MNLKIAIFFAFILYKSFSFSQATKRNEIGVEGYASTSTIGGSFSLGLKYGFNLNENLIIGPSFRMLKSWSTNTGNGSFSYSIYGIGGFAHMRYGNMVFGGTEFEVFKTPMNNFGFITGENNITSTLFIGGGFSREFKEFVRINAGVFYDALNKMNSPFRPSYLMKKTNSLTGEIAGYIPVIYRITFFFPIRKVKEESNKEDEEN